MRRGSGEPARDRGDLPPDAPILHCPRGPRLSSARQCEPRMAGCVSLVAVRARVANHRDQRGHRVVDTSEPTVRICALIRCSCVRRRAIMNPLRVRFATSAGSAWLCGSTGVSPPTSARLPFSERDGRRVGSLGSVPRLVAVDHQHGAGHEVFLPPAATIERVGTARFPRPFSRPWPFFCRPRRCRSRHGGSPTSSRRLCL